ncbi:MAG: hypothetical protein P8104_02285 [Gammaproteobacteria bacterium]
MALLLLASLIGTSVVYAGSREQAKRLHDRITGVPANAETLDRMAALIEAGSPNEAANVAMTHDAFYNVTLKNWITPWTNLDRTPFAPLNDYTATVIGIIRDDLDFRRILYDNILYTAPNSGAPLYAMTNNDHYAFLENNGISLQTALEQTTQSAMSDLPADATAGVLTTRQGARAFFSGGTNRAQLRYTLLNHLCLDLEQIKDITRSPDRIRQDVTRSPGGDSRIFLNNCVGCHAGMDPLVQSFAYYEYDYDADSDPEGENGRLIYNAEGTLNPDTGTRVQNKYLINSTSFPNGYITTTDTWTNYWREGPNRILGWDSSLPGNGAGAKSMGQELAHSEQFATCQMQKVFKTVCLRPPSSSTDRSKITTMTSSFIGNGYRIKSAFAEAALFCNQPTQ